MSRGEGRAALVLHTHMPYVEGFGTWPFGEEWLWEAIATSYLPLLDVLRAGAPVTLSLTPVLCDQLEAPGAMERCLAFLREVRPSSHALDVEAADDSGVAAELERAAGEYAHAADTLETLGCDLLGALAPFAAWTSAATHPVLPLLATEAGVRLQLRAGIEAHRARFGEDWAGGLWLPECAHAPWLDPLLEEAGVHAACVELTDRFGPGAPEHLTPLRSTAGPTLVPVDRVVMDLVWSRAGYPSHPAYRDSNAMTRRRHHPWANDGAVYDPARAAQAAREHAADFVGRWQRRVAGGGLSVCALDTELLGHWWHEGPAWLAAVVEEAARAGLELVGLDEALGAVEPVPAPDDLGVTTWGTPRDLSTWSGPAVADLAWRARDGELRVVGTGPAAGQRAVRELLALQAGDWAFLVAWDLAAPYGHERSRAHHAALLAALAAPAEAEPALRNLAPHASVAALLG
jgi:1,4-alpha-glucan branching enzyme